MGEFADRAKQMFYEGYNCCQAVVGAFAEEIQRRYGAEGDTFVDAKTAMKMAEGFGGGMGRMRLTCGAVSAMAFLAGLAHSTGLPKDLKRRGDIYALIRTMAEEFKAENGSYICAELLGPIATADNSPYPSERTPEYYKKRPCPECIYSASKIIEDKLGL